MASQLVGDGQPGHGVALFYRLDCFDDVTFRNGNAPRTVAKDLFGDELGRNFIGLVCNFAKFWHHFDLSHSSGGTDGGTVRQPHLFGHVFVANYLFDGLFCLVFRRMETICLFYWSSFAAGGDGAHGFAGPAIGVSGWFSDFGDRSYDALSPRIALAKGLSLVVRNTGGFIRGSSAVARR